MARDVGTATFTTSTGSKSVNVGVLPKSMHIVFKGSNILPAEYFIAGGFQYGYKDNASSAQTELEVKNTSGTTILKGTWTSFTGTHANFNITVQTGSVPQMLLDFEY